MAIPLTGRVTCSFTPPSLRQRNAEENVAREARGDPALPLIEMTVRIPTMYERDAFASALTRGGVLSYSQKQIRDMCIAGVLFLYPEEEFEEKHALLQQIWAWADAQLEANRRVQDKMLEIQEQQALLPEAKRMTNEQVIEKLAEIKPSIEMADTDRVRIQAIQQDVMSRYPPLQMALADVAEQDTKRRWICVETYVANWTGLEHTPTGNGRGGVTRAEAEYLRGKVGGQAFDEIADFIFALTQLDEDEEKNLDSLIESFSRPAGSLTAETMSDQATSDGSSTDASSSPTPDTASPKTTEQSSEPGSPSGTKTDESASSPTAAA